MAFTLLASIEELLWPGGFTRDVWMIVDAARDAAIYPMLVASYMEYSCLYSGPLAPAIERAAPYLVQLEFESSYTRRLLERAWGNSWGVILKCDASMPGLRRHLRQFLTVRDPRGQQLLFRYYDPRVLRVYLPTCVEDELQSMFGPIECFWIEGMASQNMVELRLDGGKLVQRTISLAVGAPRQPSGSEWQRNDVPRARTRLPQLLTIRPAQLTAFSQAGVQRFEEWMLDHLRQFFPKQCAAVREPQLRELIQYGIQRAAHHQIASERDVCKFIDLMIVFGRNFDTDRRLPWASQILANRRTARSKIRSLYEVAEARLGRS